jgi:two-component sensor histidine kinase
MAGRTHRMKHSVAQAESTPSADELLVRLAIAEAGQEEALLECEDLRDQLEFCTAECNSLEAQLTAVTNRMNRAERAVDALHRLRSQDQEMLHLLEIRLAASRAEASNAEEEFRVALEELEISSRSLAESNEQLYNLTRTLERQVDERTADLRASLADRDALIEEIHHQTRNNLQIVASLLNLQASRLAEPSATEVRKSLSRIQTMSLVHGLVFDEGSSADTPALPLLTLLCQQLAPTAASPGRITIRVTGHAGRVPLNIAGPLGLIVAELVGNALHHGFPDERPGEVEIKVLGTPATERIVVQDNGIGMDPAKATERRGLGLLLVRTLARQADAEMRFVRDGGTKVEIVLRRGMSERLQSA